MIRSILLVVILCGCAGHASSQYRRDIHKEFDRLNANLAVALNAHIQITPIWSKNSDSLFLLIDGKDYALEVSRMSLVKTKIDGKNAGWNQNEILEPISSSYSKRIRNWYKEPMFSDSLNDVKVLADTSGVYCTLTVEKKGKVIYEQKAEKDILLYPRISPNGEFLAFISDRNGLMLVRLSSEKRKISKLDKTLNKGIAAMNDNKCMTSTKWFKKALTIDNTNGTALHNLALCQFNLNHLDDLESTLKKAALHDPHYFENDELQASLNYLKGNYEEAATLGDAIMEAHPHYYENYYLLLATYEALEDSQNICRVLKTATNSGLDDPELKAYYFESCN